MEIHCWTQRRWSLSSERWIWTLCTQLHDYVYQYMLWGRLCRSLLVIELCRLVMPKFLWPLDYSPPGSSVHGISQTKILEWVAISSSKGSSWLRDWTHISCILHWRADSLSHSHWETPMEKSTSKKKTNTMEG